MARSPLENELKKHGCETSLSQFQDILQTVLKTQYKQFTVDSLMHHPSEAVAYCKTINKYQKDFETVPENLILRCLMARRKSPVRK